MGFLTSPTNCCCQVCSDCCNGIPTEFDVTLTLADVDCTWCATIGGTYNFPTLNTLCGGFYSWYSWPGLDCENQYWPYYYDYVYYKELRWSIRCYPDSNQWLLSVRFKIWGYYLNQNFFREYITNEFWWLKFISSTGVECADVCEDLPLVQKIGGGIGANIWICDPGALGNTTSCNLCAVP